MNSSKIAHQKLQAINYDCRSLFYHLHIVYICALVVALLTIISYFSFIHLYCRKENFRFTQTTCLSELSVKCANGRSRTSRRRIYSKSHRQVLCIRFTHIVVTNKRTQFAYRKRHFLDCTAPSGNSQQLHGHSLIKIAGRCNLCLKVQKLYLV